MTATGEFADILKTLLADKKDFKRGSTTIFLHSWVLASLQV